MAPPTKEQVKQLFDWDAEFGKLERQRAAISYDDTRTWVDPGGYRLSDRVWSAGRNVRLQIDNTLRDAIATGEDSLVTAKKLEQFLNPTLAPVRTENGRLVRGQQRGIVTSSPGRGGGGSYSARRLARTEVSRAHHQGTMEAATRTPGAEGWDWHTSGAHPASDRCDDYAAGSPYPLRQGPTMPAHPHCMCYSTIHLTSDVDALIRQLQEQYGLAVAEEPLVEPLALPTLAWTPERAAIARQVSNRAARSLDDFVRETFKATSNGNRFGKAVEKLYAQSTGLRLDGVVARDVVIEIAPPNRMLMLAERASTPVAAPIELAPTVPGLLTDHAARVARYDDIRAESRLNHFKVEQDLHDLTTPLYSTWPDAFKESVRDYTRGIFGDINRLLREGEGDFVTRTRVVDMDKVFATPEAMLPHDIVAYRGSIMSPESDVYKLVRGLQPGDIYVDQAFVSSSLDRNVALKFMKAEYPDAAVEFRILAPQGSRALDLYTMSNYREESEVLFNRETRFVVHSVERVGLDVTVTMEVDVAGTTLPVPLTATSEDLLAEREALLATEEKRLANFKKTLAEMPSDAPFYNIIQEDIVYQEEKVRAARLEVLNLKHAPEISKAKIALQEAEALNAGDALFDVVFGVSDEPIATETLSPAVLTPPKLDLRPLDQEWLQAQEGHFNSLPAQSKTALVEYQQNGYVTINDALRTGFGFTPDVQRAMRAIDLAFDAEESLLDVDTLLYRGVGTGPTDPLSQWLEALQPGDSFVDQAFVSTSTERAVPEDFVTRGGVGALFEIEAPAGTEAISLANLTETFESEQEILLARNTQFTVLSKTTRADGKYVIRVRAESGVRTEHELTMPRTLADQMKGASPTPWSDTAAEEAAKKISPELTQARSNFESWLTKAADVEEKGFDLWPDEQKALEKAAETLRSLEPENSALRAYEEREAEKRAAEAAAKKAKDAAEAFDRKQAEERAKSVKPIPQETLDRQRTYRKGLFEDQAKTLDRYQAEDYRAINRWLRDPGAQEGVPSQRALDAAHELGYDESAILDAIGFMDDVFKADLLALDEPTMLYRGMNTASSFWHELQVGESFVDEGFVSASRDRGVANTFAHRKFSHDLDENSFMLELRVDSGVKALDMSGAKEAEDEAEMLLNRGQAFRVTDRFTDSSGRTVIQLEVSAPEPLVSAFDPSAFESMAETTPLSPLVEETPISAMTKSAQNQFIAEQEAYFSQVSQALRDEIFTYQEFPTVNEFLRDVPDQSHWTKTAKKTRDALDQLMAMPEARLPEGLQLYRGLSVYNDSELYELFQDLVVGDSWVDVGFASTSTKIGVAEEFALEQDGDLQIILQIKTDVSARGVPLREHPDFEYQAEHLLDRNSLYTVEKIGVDGDGTFRVDVTVSHQEPTTPLATIEEITPLLTKEEARAFFQRVKAQILPPGQLATPAMPHYGLYSKASNAFYSAATTETFNEAIVSLAETFPDLAPLSLRPAASSMTLDDAKNFLVDVAETLKSKYGVIDTTNPLSADYFRLYNEIYAFIPESEIRAAIKELVQKFPVEETRAKAAELQAARKKADEEFVAKMTQKKAEAAATKAAAEQARLDAIHADAVRQASIEAAKSGAAKATAKQIATQEKKLTPKPLPAKFKKAQKELAKRLGHQVTETFDAYQGFDFKSINSVLRGLQPMKPAVERHVYYMNQAFAAPEAVMEKATQLYRGVNLTAGSQRDVWVHSLQAGDSWIDKGFVSTATDREAAMKFAETNDGWIFYEIVTEPGVRGIDVAALSGDNVSEFEILLNHETQFRLVEKIEVEPGRFILRVVAENVEHLAPAVEVSVDADAIAKETEWLRQLYHNRKVVQGQWSTVQAINTEIEAVASRLRALGVPASDVAELQLNLSIDAAKPVVSSVIDSSLSTKPGLSVDATSPAKSVAPPKPFDPRNEDWMAGDADKAFKTWSKSATSFEKNALAQYKNVEFSEINAYLRDTASVQEYVKTLAKQVEDALAKTEPLPYDLRVWRGLHYYEDEDIAAELDNLAVGDFFEDPGFVSTTLDKEVAQDFMRGEGDQASLLFEIEVPAGTHALQMEGIRTISGKDLNEAELLLQRNQRFKVVELGFDDDMGVKKVTLRLMPPNTA